MEGIQPGGTPVLEGFDHGAVGGGLFATDDDVEPLESPSESPPETAKVIATIAVIRSTTAAPTSTTRGILIVNPR